MGKMENVAAMLEYVISHNKSYYVTVGQKYKFDDQYAIADYAINVNPGDVQLDFHEQLSASCSIHAEANPPDEGWPFVCKTRTGELSKSCPNYTNLMTKLGHFAVNDTSCRAYRHVSANMALKEELESLALHPVIYHGNGAGKRTFLATGYRSYKCFLAKANITESQHSDTYG
jgi:hypothetical protein